jgi:hypothetical protein
MPDRVVQETLDGDTVGAFQVIFSWRGSANSRAR